MASRKPNVGDILNYRYLWHAESQQGQIEGAKPRPALVVALLETDGGFLKVFMLPITHSAPIPPSRGHLLPLATAQAAGLDDDENYIVYTELNSFNWRGYDIEKILFSSPPTEFFGKLDLETVNELRNLLGSCKNRLIDR